MILPFSLFVGLRQVSAGRRHLVVLLSRLSAAGLALGVAVLLLSLSVVNGFERELGARILQLVPQGTISHPQGIGDWRKLLTRLGEHPQLESGTPFIQSYAMLSAGKNMETALAQFLPLEGADVPWEQYLSAEVLEAWRGDARSVLIGVTLAQRLGVAAGDRLRLLLPGKHSPGAPLLPRSQPLRVAGVFHTRTALDNNVLVGHLPTGAQLLGYGERVQGVRLTLRDPFQAPVVLQELARRLPPGYQGSSWMHTHGNLYWSIQQSRRLVALSLLVIILVAAFNLVSTLLMMTDSQRTAIAVLKTLGATPGQIGRIFVVLATVIGLVGIAAGVVAGLVLSAVAGDFVAWLEARLQLRFLDTAVYPVGYLPVQVYWQDVVMIVLASLGACVAASLFPALRAARLPPAQVLRYR